MPLCAGRGPGVGRALLSYSVLHHELCYAASASPVEGFAYRGTIVSNVDAGIDRYKPAHRLMACPDNNHGSIEQINGKWVVFYHRHTNGHSFSRQACMEPFRLLPDSAIPQVEITSCGPTAVRCRARASGVRISPAIAFSEERI